MSAVLRLSKGKNRSVSTAAIALVLGLVAVFFLVRYGQEVLLEHDLSSQAAAQRQENAQLQDTNTRLEANLQYYQSTKYIEQRAREDLNLRRSDEEVLIPTNLDDTTAGNASNTGISSQKPGDIGGTGEQSTPTNASKWFMLFAPSPPASSP